jgi:hypothetical protein
MDGPKREIELLFSSCETAVLVESSIRQASGMQYKVRVGGRETWIAALPESLKHEFSQEELEQMLQQVLMVY